MKTLIFLLLAPIFLSAQTFPLKLIDGKLHVVMFADGILTDVPVEFSSKASAFKLSDKGLTSNRPAGKILNTELLRRLPQPILFDFQNMELIAGYRDFETFRAVPARISSEVQLLLKVRWKDYRFGLFPNHSFWVVMKCDRKMKFLTGYSTGDSHGRYYPGIGVGIAGRDYGSGISICESCANRIGTAFMSGFDWIIDFKEESVMVRKNLRMLEVPSATQVIAVD